MQTQETESKSESQVYITWNFFFHLLFLKTFLIFFSDFHFTDRILNFLRRSWFFLDFLARLIAKILVRNLKDPWFWHERKKPDKKFRTPSTGYPNTVLPKTSFIFIHLLMYRTLQVFSRVKQSFFRQSNFLCNAKPSSGKVDILEQLSHFKERFKL